METMNRTGKKLFFVIIPIVIILLIAVGYFIVVMRNDKIYSKISVGQVDVSNLSKEEAINKVKSQDLSLTNANLTLEYGNSSWSIPYSSLGAKYNIEQAVNKAYLVGRNGNYLSRFKDILKARAGLKYDLVFDYDKNYLTAQINNIKLQVDTTSKDAKIIPTKGGGTVRPHTNGVVVDIDKTVALVDQYITKMDPSPIPLQVVEAAPRVSAELLRDMTIEMSSFSTKFNTSDTLRTNNIKLACQRINGTILNPNQEFSVDSTIRERTAANGYKVAKAYFQNEVVDETGGGVCQVTTTLYDAVLLANLKVTERNQHSMMVDYVEPGFDAAVSDKGVDLKFKNSCDFPIYLYSSVEGNQVIMKIFGKRKDTTQEIRLEPQVTEIYYSDPDEVIFDNTLQKGAKRVSVKPRNGYKASLYKNVYKNGVLVSRELISENLYKPRRGKVLIGI